MEVYVILIVLVTVAFLRMSQCNDEVGKQGQMFVFAIPATYLYTYIPRVMITTSSEDLINVTLSVPGFSFEWTNTINRRRHANIALPSDIIMTKNDGTQNKTIIVRSSGVVSVHAIEEDNYGGDGFLVYPTTELGTKYYVSAYSISSYTSFFCITSLADTVINVTESTGPTQSILLRQYESFRFDSNSDLSGTLIQSNRDIYVTSGTRTLVPLDISCCYDGLLEQLLPVRKWGTMHILAPFLSLNAGYLYRIYTANMSTVLNITEVGNNRTITLQPSERFYEGNVEDNVMVTVISDQPVMIMQYVKSSDAYNPALGDPAMVLVPPVTSFTGNVTFSVFKYNLAPPVTSVIGDDTFPVTYDPLLYQSGYFVNVVIECSMMKGLRFDGPVLAASESDEVYSADLSMCCVRRTVSPGQHFVTHSDINAVFSVSVYAYAEIPYTNIYSYAYIAGGGTHEQGFSTTQSSPQVNFTTEYEHETTKASDDGTGFSTTQSSPQVSFTTEHEHETTEASDDDTGFSTTQSTPQVNFTTEHEHETTKASDNDTGFSTMQSTPQVNLTTEHEHETTKASDDDTGFSTTQSTPQVNLTTGQGHETTKASDDNTGFSTTQSTPQVNFTTEPEHKTTEASDDDTGFSTTQSTPQVNLTTEHEHETTKASDNDTGISTTQSIPRVNFTTEHEHKTTEASDDVTGFSTTQSTPQVNLTTGQGHETTKASDDGTGFSTTQSTPQVKLTTEQGHETIEASDDDTGSSAPSSALPVVVITITAISFAVVIIAVVVITIIYLRLKRQNSKRRNRTGALGQNPAAMALQPSSKSSNANLENIETP